MGLFTLFYTGFLEIWAISNSTACCKVPVNTKAQWITAIHHILLKDLVSEISAAGGRLSAVCSLKQHTLTLQKSLL